MASYYITYSHKNGNVHSVFKDIKTKLDGLDLLNRAQLPKDANLDQPKPYMGTLYQENIRAQTSTKIATSYIL